MKNKIIQPLLRQTWQWQWDWKEFAFHFHWKWRCDFFFFGVRTKKNKCICWMIWFVCTGISDSDIFSSSAQPWLSSKTATTMPTTWWRLIDSVKKQQRGPAELKLHDLVIAFKDANKSLVTLRSADSVFRCCGTCLKFIQQEREEIWEDRG